MYIVVPICSSRRGSMFGNSYVSVWCVSVDVVSVDCFVRVAVVMGELSVGGSRIEVGGVVVSICVFVRISRCAVGQWLLRRL